MAAKMSHRLLNPYIYRDIQDIGDLDALATLLDAPGNWLERYDHVRRNSFVIRTMEVLRSLPGDTSEANIKCQVNCLVTFISIILGLCPLPNAQTKIIIGGILATHQYDLRSSIGLHFLTFCGKSMIAFEAKRDRTFTDQEMWYHRLS